MIIRHGKPEHAHFGVYLPTSYIRPTIDDRRSDYVKPVHNFIDPYSGEKFDGEVQEIATLTIDEFLSHSIPSLLSYGQYPKDIVDNLQKRYPEIKRTQQICLIVFKQL